MSKKPTWANWIENEELPHTVDGVECRGCSRQFYFGDTKVDPNVIVNWSPWENIEHENGCKR